MRLLSKSIESHRYDKSWDQVTIPLRYLSNVLSHTTATWALRVSAKHYCFVTQWLFNRRLYDKTFSRKILDLLNKSSREIEYLVVGVLVYELRRVARRDYLMFGRNPYVWSLPGYGQSIHQITMLLMLVKFQLGKSAGIFLLLVLIKSPFWHTNSSPKHEVIYECDCPISAPGQ